MNNNLTWWCQECRSTGMMVHCAHPEECGSMKRIPREEAARQHAALKARAQATTQDGEG